MQYNTKISLLILVLSCGLSGVHYSNNRIVHVFEYILCNIKLTVDFNAKDYGTKSK